MADTTPDNVILALKQEVMEVQEIEFDLANGIDLVRQTAEILEKVRRDEDDYRIDMFKVDRLIREYRDIEKALNESFGHLGCLHPKLIYKATKDDCILPCQMFPDDLKDADLLFLDIRYVRNDVMKTNPKTVCDASNVFAGKRCLYLAKAYQLALTAPVSVVSNEHPFSRLKLLKTYLRSNMSDDRLDNLMIIACESDLTNKIDVGKLADKWSKHKEDGREQIENENFVDVDVEENLVSDVEENDQQNGGFVVEDDVLGNILSESQSVIGENFRKIYVEKKTA
eukprot:gene16866-8341_t